MPRPLSGQQNSTPVVSLIGTEKNRAPVGRYFIGVLKAGPRVVRMRKGSGKVYEFGILETDAPVQKKNQDGKFVEVDVNEGDVVSIFAPTALAGALTGAKLGEIVQIVYDGVKQTKNGTDFHSFNVDALTQEEYNAAR